MPLLHSIPYNASLQLASVSLWYAMRISQWIVLENCRRLLPDELRAVYSYLGTLLMKWRSSQSLQRLRILVVDLRQRTDSGTDYLFLVEVLVLVECGRR